MNSSPRRARTLWRALRRLAWLALLGTALLLITARWWLPAVGSWLALAPNPARADAIAIHGGNRNRTLYGFERYGEGFGDQVWHTGFAYQKTSITDLAVGRGVPRDKFHYLVTTSTWEDGRAIADFARQQHVRSIIVVTEWWHSRRAVCIDRQDLAGSGIAIYYTPPTNTRFQPNNWWQSSAGRRAVISELLKFCYYWVRYDSAPWRC